MTLSKPNSSSIIFHSKCSIASNDEEIQPFLFTNQPVYFEFACFQPLTPWLPLISFFLPPKAAAVCWKHPKADRSGRWQKTMLMVSAYPEYPEVYVVLTNYLDNISIYIDAERRCDTTTIFKIWNYFKTLNNWISLNFPQITGMFLHPFQSLKSTTENRRGGPTCRRMPQMVPQ